MSDEPESIRTLARKIRTTDDANEALRFSKLMLQLAWKRRTAKYQKQASNRFKVGDRVRTTGYRNPDDPSHDVDSWTGTIVDRPVYCVERDHPDLTHRSFYAMQESGLLPIEEDPY